MAETVKKSRIVSDEDDNLEESLLEEFNMRLKNCMSEDNLQNPEQQVQEENSIYENISNNTRQIPKSGVASNDFILSERENYYDQPASIEDGSKRQNGHDLDDDTENIYETLPEEIEKTENLDQYVDMSSPDNTKNILTLEVSPEIEVENTAYEEFEVASPKDLVVVENSYEVVEAEENGDKPCFAFKTTDFSESKSLDADSKSSVRDRMFLATDDAATLLFTQTVTSPMLTPSEENIDFLKGFQRENTNSDNTVSSNESPEKEEESDKVANEEINTSDLSGEISASEPLANIERNHEKENIYENAEFLKRNSETIYENLKETRQELVEENIYENLKDVNKADGAFKETIENIYQDVEECEKEVVYENVGEPEVNAVILEDTLSNNTNEIEYSKTEMITDLDANETKHAEAVEETTEHAERSEQNHFERITSNNTDHVDSNDEMSESYSEFVHHSKSESNYYEKYTSVVSKNSRNVEISNREKDTETVPAEIVKNLKSQFLKTGVEVVATTKKEVTEANELKTINIMKQINKFEQKDSPDSPAKDLDDKSSFSKFDALQKKNVLHVRSSDSTKAQEKFNGAQQIDATNCRACSKQVFQMEQIKAEKAIWHKNCFRCTECSKQLTVETYVSHEGNLYCKPHFKSLFAPKVVEDEAPPSDKPDLGLEELQSLNVKERFQVFEHHQTETQESDRGPTPVNVKRSPSILSKLARFQAKGMDVGVSDEALNGIPIEESTSEEEEEEEEVPEGEDPTLFKAKRVQKEKPFHFTSLHEVKNKWEHGEQNSKDERREERKQEIQSIRNRLFMGKQGKMKEAYQQAVMQSESCTNMAKSEKIESCDTKSLKERFEKGDPINEKELKTDQDEEEVEVFQSEISKNSRSLFLELDANASKAPQVSPVTPQQKLDVKKARETDTPDREIYHDPEVVRAEDGFVDDSVIAKTTHTASKMLNKFRQMEENLAREPENAGPKPLKRFTPPPEPTRPESSSEGESGSEEEESEDEDQVDNQKIPEDLLEAQKAARAKQLRAKFEKWEAQEIRKEQTNTVNIVEEYGEDSQVESTKSLRARFESMREGSSDNSRTPRVKVNRFV